KGGTPRRATRPTPMKWYSFAHLLCAALVALRNHLDRPDLRGVGHFVARTILRAAGEDEQCLFVGPAERAADHPTRRGNDAEMFPVSSDHLDPGAGRHVDASLRIDRTAVAAAREELHELALVGEGPVRLHVERRERRAIRDVQRFLVRAEDDAV